MGGKKSSFGQMKDAFKRSLGEQKLEKVKFKWKRSLILIAVGILAYVIMRVILELDFKYSFVVWFVYEGIAAVGVIAYVVTVRGNLSSRPLTEDMLPDDWSPSEKAEYIRLDSERRARGKKYLYIAFPFIVAVMIGIVTEIWWPLVTGKAGRY